VVESSFGSQETGLLDNQPTGCGGQSWVTLRPTVPGSVCPAP